MLDREEFNRWFSQASHTWESARRDHGDGDYSWACFKAQQAGEFALETLLRSLGRVVTGHSLRALLERLNEQGIETDGKIEIAGRHLRTVGTAFRQGTGSG